MDYPYLLEKPDRYWIAREEGFYWGIVDKTSNLKNADWLRKRWHHEINWEGEWGKRDRIAFEQMVSGLLLADKVVSNQSSKRAKMEQKPVVDSQSPKLFPKVLRRSS